MKLKYCRYLANVTCLFLPSDLMINTGVSFHEELFRSKNSQRADMFFSTCGRGRIPKRILLMEFSKDKSLTKAKYE